MASGEARGGAFTALLKVHHGESLVEDAEAFATAVRLPVDASAVCHWTGNLGGNGGGVLVKTLAGTMSG